MKYFFYLVGALLLFASCQNHETGFTINGEIYDAETGLVILKRRNADTWQLDSLTSAEIHNGKFVLKGELEHPTMCYLTIITDFEYTDKDGNVQIMKPARTDVVILENATMAYKAWVKDLGNRILDGSEMHDKVLMLTKTNKDLYDLKKYSDAIMGYAGYKKFKEKVPQEEVNPIVKEYQKASGEFSKERNKIVASIVEADTCLDYKVLLLETYGLRSKASLESAKSILPDVIAANGEEHYHVKMLNTMIEKAAMVLKTDVGNKYIDVTSKDMADKTLALSSFIGKDKYVLLEFWASWCGPCRKEIPEMKHAYKEFNSKGFEIYAISIDKKEDDWKKASKEEKLPWINTHYFSDPKINAQTTYSVSSIPANFLIGPDGTIVARNLRGDDLAKKLGELLN
jgi:peroxiredoxin